MRTPETPPSYPDFLARLEGEERQLRDALASLADLHAALTGGDLSNLAAQEVRQAELAAALRDARVAQAAAADRLAADLGLADKPARLAVIAEKLPPPAAQVVLAARDRLAALTHEIAESHRRNANLAHQLRSYLRSVFALLTEASPARYGPQGATVTAAGAATAVRTTG